MDIKKAQIRIEHLTFAQRCSLEQLFWLYKDRNKMGKWYHFRGKLILENEKWYQKKPVYLNIYTGL